MACTIKKWVRKKKPLNQQLSDVESDLSILQQAPPHLTDHAKEVFLIQQHNLILDKITKHYRQLSKKHWTTEGDRNTRFFQQSCTRRRHKNRILFISKGENTMVSSPLDIANELISYFTNLFTSSIPRLEFIFHFEGIMTNEFTTSVPSIDECLKI
jgi:hypothetical protein